ncbi:hypothetical protein BGP_1942 [Beggiatoa sp. PS]|nr:hypothetical protein BGP_1942 [Beggiatoa sp. PS]
MDYDTNHVFPHDGVVLQPLCPSILIKSRLFMPLLTPQHVALMESSHFEVLGIYLLGFPVTLLSFRLESCSQDILPNILATYHHLANRYTLRMS